MFRAFSFGLFAVFIFNLSICSFFYICVTNLGEEYALNCYLSLFLLQPINVIIHHHHLQWNVLLLHLKNKHKLLRQTFILSLQVFLLPPSFSPSPSLFLLPSHSLISHLSSSSSSSCSKWARCLLWPPLLHFSFLPFLSSLSHSYPLPVLFLIFILPPDLGSYLYIPLMQQLAPKFCKMNHIWLCQGEPLESE